MNSADDTIWSALVSPGGYEGWTAAEPVPSGAPWCACLVQILGVEVDESGPCWNYSEPVWVWGDSADACRAAAVKTVLGLLAGERGEG